MRAQSERPVPDPDDTWVWAELWEGADGVDKGIDSAPSPTRPLRLWRPPPRPGRPLSPEVWRAAGEGLASALVAGLGLAVAGVVVAVLAAGILAVALVWAGLALGGLSASLVAVLLAASIHWSQEAWRRSESQRGTVLHFGRATGSAGWSTSRRAARFSVSAGGATVRLAASAATILWAWSVFAWSKGRALLPRARVRKLAIGTVTSACLATSTILTVVVAPVAWQTAGAALSADRAPLALPPLAEGSQVFAADGTLVAVFHGTVNRRPVPLNQVAPVMRQAIVATEDVRFWHHGGVDLYALGRASVADLLPGHDRQGGSTLAMQLVKNTLLAGRPDNWADKVREAVLANRLEARLGAPRVLSAYLNTVYFGEGAYGVQAASETYFGVPASAIDLPQAALLAGLVQDPVGYDPISNPGDARTRRGTVLALMAKARLIGPGQVPAADRAPLPTTVQLPPDGRNFFLEAVKDELLTDRALGATPAARYHALYSGGLRIYTTLDPTMEAQATKAVSQMLPSSALHLSAALAAVDPSSGAVRAVVGGPDFAASQFDAALAAPGRPTGSAFKVFTLVAALEKGWTPSSYLDGTGPCTISDPGYNPDPWNLNNYEGEASGGITLTTATAQSVNCAFARLAMQVGLPAIARVAHQMGIRAPLAVVPSMTLGTNSIPPLQMASAYATLAAGGVYHQPHLVTRVFSSAGRVLMAPASAGVRVISAGVAAATTNILQQVVSHGTGTAARIPGRSVAGKTGTGGNWADAWFVGYTPALSAAVWMGAPSGEVPMLDVDGINVAGGTYPTRIWQSFMAAATSTQPPTPFPGVPPGQVAPGSAGTPPMGTGPGATTGGTTWCWSSCGRSGQP